MATTIRSWLTSQTEQARAFIERFGPGEEGQIDPEEIERFLSLGYIGE